jgi:alkaline phosphatase D
VFVLDARSYRDRNDLRRTPENDKDMLGREQIAWLVDGIRQSTATWKIVSSDVPMSIGTGSVAFGGMRGRTSAPSRPASNGNCFGCCRGSIAPTSSNVVFVTTDVHFAQTIATTSTPTAMATGWCCTSS